MSAVVVVKKREKKKKRKPAKRVRSKDTPWIENKIYTYGAKAPVDNIDLFNEQLLLGHRFRNSMVELERARRARVEAAVAKLPANGRLKILEEEFVRENEKLAELRAQKRALNSKLRSKKAIDPILNTNIKILRARLKRLRARRKKLRKELFESPAWKQGALPYKPMMP